MVSKTKLKRHNSNNAKGWLLNAPYLIYTLLLFLIPLGWAIWLSAMNWNLMSKHKQFVGIKNFLKMFSDPKIKAAFINSFCYLIPIVLLCFVCGLFIALMVGQLPDKIKGTVAVLFFIPYLTSGVATSVLVKYFFSYDSVLNVFLRTKFNMDVLWLQNEKSAFWIMVIIVVWKMSGYYALFILSAVEEISSDVNEACQLDGAHGFQKLLRVTIPMILPSLTTVVVLATGLAFGMFTEPYLLTGGGPNLATTTWQLEIYNTSFVSFNSGYGAALAIANAIQIYIAIRLISFAMNKLNNKYGS